MAEHPLRSPLFGKNRYACIYDYYTYKSMLLYCSGPLASFVINLLCFTLQSSTLSNQPSYRIALLLSNSDFLTILQGETKSFIYKSINQIV